MLNLLLPIFLAFSFSGDPTLCTATSAESKKVCFFDCLAAGGEPLDCGRSCGYRDDQGSPIDP